MFLYVALSEQALSLFLYMYFFHYVFLSFFLPLLNNIVINC